MSSFILHPSRMSDGKALAILKRMSPEDLGINFDPVIFHIRDLLTGKPIQIVGWWMLCPVASTRTIVLLHGYGDAKVGSIAWASLWHELGYNILAIDLRAHGDSQGDFVTGGFAERDDVDQVINDLRSSRPHETQEMALVGISFGGAVALATASLRTDIQFCVMDSPISTYPRALSIYMKRAGLPIVCLHPLTIRLAQWRAGIEFARFAPVTLLQQPHCPVLLIQGDEDHYAPPDVITEFRTIASNPDNRLKHHVIPGARHNLPIQYDYEAYVRFLRDFLSKIHIN